MLNSAHWRLWKKPARSMPIKIVGFDGQPEARQAVKDGKL